MRFHGHRLIKTHPQVKPEVTDMGSSSDLREGYDRKHSCRFVGCAIPQESGIIPDDVGALHLGFARMVALSRGAVELKFSSHRSVISSTASSRRRGWGYPRRCLDSASWLRPEVALARGAVELKFSSHRSVTTSTASSSGEGGIRTHGGRKAHSGFQDRRFNPLSHLS